MGIQDPGRPADESGMALDHLARLLEERGDLTVETQGGVELDAWVEALDPSRNRLTLRLRDLSPPVSPGETLKLAFGFAGQRWMGITQLHHYPDRSCYVANLPKGFQPGDRRVAPRWRPEAPEGRVQVRTHLGEGLEFRGPLVSISESGLALRVDHLEGPEGPRRWEEGLLEAGQALDVVRLAGLEGLMPLEGEGRLAWAGLREGRLHLGLRLRGLPEPAREALRAFLAPRLPELPIILPPSPPPQPRREDPAQAARAQALRRLKKRGRNLAIAMPPGPARDALETFLEADGYDHVWRVDSIPRWLELVAERAVDLVFIDGGFRELQDLELASFLHQSRGEQTFAIVVALPTLGTSYGLLMRKAGVKHLVSKPYDLDAAFARELETALEIV